MTSTIIIIPEEDQEAANEAALGFDPVGGAQTFTVPLSPSGNSPATHFWCAGMLTAEQANQFQAAVPSANVSEWDMDSAPEFPEVLLAQQNLKRVATEADFL